MDLRGPHITGTPARPFASRENVALQSEWSTVEVRESLSVSVIGGAGTGRIYYGWDHYIADASDYNILALYISNADAIKKQQKARNAPSRGLWVP